MSSAERILEALGVADAELGYERSPKVRQGRGWYLRQNGEDWIFLGRTTEEVICRSGKYQQVCTLGSSILSQDEGPPEPLVDVPPSTSPLHLRYETQQLRLKRTGAAEPSVDPASRHDAPAEILDSTLRYQVEGQSGQLTLLHYRGQDAYVWEVNWAPEPDREPVEVLLLAAPPALFAPLAAQLREADEQGRAVLSAPQFDLTVAERMWAARNEQPDEDPLTLAYHKMLMVYARTRRALDGRRRTAASVERFKEVQQNLKQAARLRFPGRQPLRLGPARVEMVEAVSPPPRPLLQAASTVPPSELRAASPGRTAPASLRSGEATLSDWLVLSLPSERFERLSEEAKSRLGGEAGDPELRRVFLLFNGQAAALFPRSALAPVQSLVQELGLKAVASLAPPTESAYRWRFAVEEASAPPLSAYLARPDQWMAGNTWQPRTAESDYRSAKERSAWHEQQIRKYGLGELTPWDMQSYPFKHGDWVMSESVTGWGREIEQLREIDPETISVHQKVDRAESLIEQFADWLRQGIVAPPISLVVHASGVPVVVDGKKRWLAALRAGKPILAWCLDSVWGTPDELGGFSALTFELVNPRAAYRTLLALSMLRRVLNTRLYWRSEGSAVGRRETTPSASADAQPSLNARVTVAEAQPALSDASDADRKELVLHRYSDDYWAFQGEVDPRLAYVENTGKEITDLRAFSQVTRSHAPTAVGYRRRSFRSRSDAEAAAANLGLSIARITDDREKERQRKEDEQDARLVRQRAQESVEVEAFIKATQLAAASGAIPLSWKELAPHMSASHLKPWLKQIAGINELWLKSGAEAIKKYRSDLARAFDQAVLDLGIKAPRIGPPTSRAWAVALEAQPNEDFEPGSYTASLLIPPRWEAVPSLVAAVAEVRRFISRHEVGGGNFVGQAGRVTLDGQPYAHISYNGNIWRVGSNWKETGEQLDTDGKVIGRSTVHEPTPDAEPLADLATEPPPSSNAAPPVQETPQPKNKSRDRAVDDELLTRQKRAEKLRKVAERLAEEIESLRDSGTHHQRPTARRARIAAGQEDHADWLEKVRSRLLALADALENKCEPPSLEGLDLVEYRCLPDSLEEVDSRTLVEELLRRKELPRPIVRSYNLRDALKALESAPDVEPLREVARRLIDRCGDEGYCDAESAEEIAALEALSKRAEAATTKSWAKSTMRAIREELLPYKRALAAGLGTPERWRQAREDLANLGGQATPAPNPLVRQIRDKERALIGQDIPGYFPTPRDVVEQMVAEADLRPGLRVLEPSAGKGSIAEGIRAAGIEPDVIERVPQLRELLQLKDFRLVASDFLSFQGRYDRILMNPPFEAGQDMDHVEHAYNLLVPGGRLVAIMSEGPFFREDAKARAFRQWLENADGTSTQLPQGSFLKSDRPTGVNTRLIVIDKSPSSVGASPQVETDAEVRSLPSPTSSQAELAPERQQALDDKLMQLFANFVTKLGGDT